MANVAEILGQIDAGIASYTPIITELQNNYRSQNGHYWQGLFTHSSPPIDANTGSPDLLDNSPTDQAISWDDIAGGVMPAEMLSRIRIDTYSSPQGEGFVIVAEKIVNNTTYQKSYNVGPEDHRNSDWQEISDTDP
mgnify:FL=1